MLFQNDPAIAKIPFGGPNVGLDKLLTFLHILVPAYDIEHRGCGTTAIYNANEILGIHDSFQSIVDFMTSRGEPSLIGVNPAQITKYYRERGYKVNTDTKPAGQYLVTILTIYSGFGNFHHVACEFHKDGSLTAHDYTTSSPNEDYPNIDSYLEFMGRGKFKMLIMRNNIG